MKVGSIIALLLGFYAGPCAGQEAAAPGAGRLADPVVCRTDPSQSYALYIPKKGNVTALPVVFFFDPHGAGSLPLNKYRSLAEAYGFILVGSNNSKNGNDWPTTGQIWDRLYDDVLHRLGIDGHRIYVCGFSGGAKVASYVAIQHPGIRGVIAGGAALPDGVSADNFPFSFTALAGEGDMNLTDIVATSNDLDKTRTRHRLIVFDGKHEWAPLAVMDQAFAGWRLDAMRDGTAPRDNGFIDGYITRSKGRVAADIQAGHLIKAERECRFSANGVDGLSAEANWFKQKGATLSADSRYRQQDQEQQSLFRKEEELKAVYRQQFQQGDNRYWQQTIKDLDAKTAMATPEKGMYQRLLAYLSLAFYSISNQLITARRSDGARHFVELYKLADPTNSEAWYFSGVLDVREGHIPQAESDLVKAVEEGFRDKQRLRNQPEFQKSFTPASFERIEGKMHR